MSENGHIDPISMFQRNSLTFWEIDLFAFLHAVRLKDMYYSCAVPYIWNWRQTEIWKTACIGIMCHLSTLVNERTKLTS